MDEDLPNFFESIKLSQADELVKEEENMKNYFGIQVNDPDTVSRLDATKIPKKAIQGTPWYTILSNTKYSMLFYFIGAHINEREKLIEDGSPDDPNNIGDMPEKQKRERCEQSD